jgi:hypothetical protein
MLDISKLKSRLSSLTNQGNKTNLIWKPKPGKQIVRIVPYKYEPDNPFIELKFHYNINNKTYLSPDSFGRPDPIVEFSNRLKKTGSKEDWQMGRKMEPKMRTFAPVIVRGEEHEGIKFWGFGKQVYQELLSIISDPDFGDITDTTNGRDIVVEFKTAEGSTSFPETSIRVKPNVSVAVDPKNSQLLDAVKSQVNILDLFPELSYEELKEVMDKWLNPNTESSDTAAVDSTSTVVATADDDDVPFATPANVASTTPSPTAIRRPASGVYPTTTTKVDPKTVSPTATKAKAKDSVEQSFDDLFNS